MPINVTPDTGRGGASGILQSGNLLNKIENLSRQFGMNPVPGPRRKVVARNNQGMQFKTLSLKTNVRPGNLKYHLAILKLTNKIAVLSSDGHARYFENAGNYTPCEQKVLKYLQNGTERVILERLIMDPATTRSDLEKNWTYLVQR
jgi:hypothetical protein